MSLRKERGFKLIEILIVIIIIGILAILALPQFGKAKERAMDKEAIANLKLISAAEKIYRMEATYYYPNSGTAAVGGMNTFLRLSLPEGSSRNWDYTIESGGTASFDARGARYSPPSGWGRTFKINQTLEEPCCISGGNCPPDMTTCP